MWKNTYCTLRFNYLRKNWSKIWINLDLLWLKSWGIIFSWIISSVIHTSQLEKEECLLISKVDEESYSNKNEPSISIKFNYFPENWYKRIHFIKTNFLNIFCVKMYIKLLLLLLWQSKIKISFDFRLQTLSITTPSRVLEWHVRIIISAEHFTYW